MNYGVYSQNYVSGIINNCGSIARSDAESRLTRRICGFNHSGAARSKYYIGLLHKKICHIKRRNVYPAYYALRSTGFNCRFKNDFCSLYCGLFRSRVWAYNNAVSGFKTNQGLENCGRCRVGGGDNRRNNAYRLCNLFHTKRAVFLYYTAGLCIFICIVDIFCGIVVFDYLIFDYAHSRLFNSHFGKWDSRFVCCDSRRFKDLIDLLLRISRKNLFCLSDSCEKGFEFFYRIDNLMLVLSFHRYIISFSDITKFTKVLF